MKKFVGVFFVVMFCLINVSQTRGDADDGNHVFYYDDIAWQTINDWTKVGAYGYENYWALTSAVDTPNNNAFGAGYETRLYIETPSSVVIPKGMWAGYEWKIPSTVNESIVQFHIEGYFSFGPGLELRVTNGEGDVLWTHSAIGAIDTDTPVFTATDTIRVIMYGTSPTGAWGWAGNYAYVGLHAIYTQDGSVEPLPNLNVPAYGNYFTASSSGNFASQVNGIANIAHMYFNPADADVVIANNQKLLIDLTWQFWDGVNGSGLRSDFISQWGMVSGSFQPYKDHIAAFYVIDEPDIAEHNFTPAQLQMAIACIKADFPNIPVMTTYSYLGVNAFTSSSNIPSNLDWIGFDQYNNFSAIPALLTKVKTYKQSYQKVFLVPQGYRNGLTDATVADWSYDYYDLYLSDPEILGQLVFLCRGAREVIWPSDGTMPLTYANQQVIGTEVLKMGNDYKRAFSDMLNASTLSASNWPSIGTKWTSSTTVKRSGSYSARVAGSVTDSALTSKAITVSDADTASVSFWWYINSAVDAGEYIRLDVKLDSGAWVQKASIDGDVSAENKWLHVIVSNIDVSAATNLYIRFRGKMNGTTEYGYVDSVNVSKW